MLVNGKSVGVRLARPFSFDLTDNVHKGENTLSVHVANTIAPHYQTIPSQNLGPVEPGLNGAASISRKYDIATSTLRTDSQADDLSVTVGALDNRSLRCVESETHVPVLWPRR